MRHLILSSLIKCGSGKVVKIPRLTNRKEITIGNRFFIGRNVHLIGPLTIGNEVEIRDNVRIYSKNVTIGNNVTIGEGTIIIGNVHIRSGAWISRGCDISGNVTIDDCIMGPRVGIYSGKHIKKDKGYAMESEPGHIYIGRGSWIGASAIILSDVSKGTLVGAGTVVTKKYQENLKILGEYGRPCK